MRELFFFFSFFLLFLFCIRSSALALLGQLCRREWHGSWRKEQRGIVWIVLWTECRPLCATTCWANKTRIRTLFEPDKQTRNIKGGELPPPPSMQKFLYKILLLLLKRKKERKKERKKARAKIYRRGRQEATAGQKMQTYRDFLRLNLCDRLWNRRDEIRWRFDRALSPSFGG